ncbi:MAG: silver transporter [Gemmataceae bacterium]
MGCRIPRTTRWPIDPSVRSQRVRLMVERIIEGCIRNRWLTVALALCLTVWALYAVLDTPMDAIPDLSENQVIVFTDWPGRSPREIEDQITYPLTLKLQGLAGVRVIRSSSEFSFSLITIIFEDGVDFYFARERVLERLTLASTFLPPGVTPYLASDATALGQIFWYTIEGEGLTLERAWALQRFYIGPELNSVPGVAEVAAVGGMPREYQIDVRPEVLRAYGVTLGELVEAVARSNLAVGGRVIQKAGAEYLVRSVGWIESVRDIENIVVREVEGTPVHVKDVARVQLGPQFRRGVFEKNGNEVAGGVVLMRYGENPLEVTRRIRDKIQQLQSGLPPGVRIVPAYERTRLIYGAIDTLTKVLWHEIAIAAAAVVLVLWHFRSALLICLTLPLSVLFSFWMLWILRKLGIVDVQVNIMSLAGIAVSIGILVDQAVVMVENATHRLKAHFGEQRVRGDTTELVVAACRVVGRPIFYSVMIVLLSFLPVFALSGREGKLFHPMAFTKSLAMVGVAVLSVTLVPALIPLMVRGRLRSEEESWLVRTLIGIYRPVLAWALERRNLVLWSFAALLLLAAGLFPIPAVLGMGASEYAWRIAFLLVYAVVVTISVALVIGWWNQILSLVTLTAVALVAWHFPRIGVAYMPPLDEGSLMDMPVTIPRASVAQATDDLKARNALLRSFPEVESVVGKAGRADTPTDPAPIEMVETFVNFRPHEFWPRRVLKYADARRQTRAVLAALERQGWLARAELESDRDALVSEATMFALEEFDRAQRQLALERFREIEQALEPLLTRHVVALTVRAIEASPHHVQASEPLERVTEEIVAELTPRYGPWLARHPALEDVHKVMVATAERLREQGHAHGSLAELLDVRRQSLRQWVHLAGEWLLGLPTLTPAQIVLESVEKKRHDYWRNRMHLINAELFDHGVEAYTWSAITALARAARARGLVARAPRGPVLEQVLQAEVSSQTAPESASVVQEVQELRSRLAQEFAGWVLFWTRQGGRNGDLRQELDTVVQVPGWSNIWTMPIANRIDMLSTGIRTTVGIKVFGPDLATIEHVGQQIEQVLRTVRGAKDVFAERPTIKGYLEIAIRREQAARYGIRIADIQDTIEAALGGRVVTQTVEGRERYPVRIRYARAAREDVEEVKRLLVSRPMPTVTGTMPAETDTASAMHETRPSTLGRAGREAHRTAPPHVLEPATPLQVPLAELADVRLVPGPAMIRSENARLVSYVTLNVSADRDLVGFVEEARRAVLEKVPLPEGVHLEWSGEFEHQMRAARTLRLVFPLTLAIIFLILYLTYFDLMDALLIMAAVPEAIAGGIFFQVLFPKLMHGWDAAPVDFSVAVWVGYIAAFGMATETGIIMVVYLREAIAKRGGLENIRSLDELKEAVLEGAVHRLRPKLLTEGTSILAVAPMLWASGVGAEILSAMALPVLGGLLIADEVVDIFLPVRFYWVRRQRWLRLQEQKARHQPGASTEDTVQAQSQPPSATPDQLPPGQHP